MRNSRPSGVTCSLVEVSRSAGPLVVAADAAVDANNPSRRSCCLQLGGGGRGGAEGGVEGGGGTEGQGEDGNGGGVIGGWNGDGGGDGDGGGGVGGGGSGEGGGGDGNGGPGGGGVGGGAGGGVHELDVHTRLPSYPQLSPQHIETSSAVHRRIP